MTSTKITNTCRRTGTGLVVLLALLLATPAQAFRCGNKLIIENMLESQVRNACGDPSSARHLGFALRSVEPARRRGLSGPAYRLRYGGPAHYVQEVAVTELIYNFGPRKFMRRLVFEGGKLVSIEAIGYGYRESRK